MDLYGLIGNPLEHSFSKKYFSEKFSDKNIDAEYRLWQLQCIEKLTDLLSIQNLKGFNVTIPFKREVQKYLDIIDAKALYIGAVNVVKIVHESNKITLKGYNTDVIGFRKSIEPLLSKEKEYKALILGTGGASAAVKCALSDLSIESTFVSRHPTNDAIGYESLNQRLFENHNIIINATPIGTYPNINKAPAIPYQFISSKHICHDLVYNPSETLFMKLCQEKGAIVKNGLDMLYIQAEEAWNIWNDESL